MPLFENVSMLRNRTPVPIASIFCILYTFLKQKFVKGDLTHG